MKKGSRKNEETEKARHATPSARKGVRRVHGWHHLLLPTRSNSHHPHILKREIVAGVLVCAIVLEVAVLAQGFILFKNQDYLASVLPSVVASLTNDQRTQNDLPALTVSPLLSEAAQEKANDMAAKGYFSHVSPDGTLPWTWFKAVGYDYQFAGENLAINFNDSADVVNAWMASPEHRANILKQQYTQVGIGMATGMYEGKSTIFVVQFFATPESGTDGGVAIANPPADNDVAAAIPTIKETPISAPAAPVHTAAVNTPASKAAVANVPAPTELMTTSNPVTPTSDAASDASAVLGAETQTAPVATSPSFLQTLLASPFTSANDIFLFITAFVIALLVMALIFRNRLPRMTATIGGLSVVAVVFGFAIINQHYFSHAVSVDQVSAPITTAQ